LVAAARAAVAGGATALVLCGAVPAHPEGSWLAGPAVAPVTERLVAEVTAATGQGRVPDVPLVAGGGVVDTETALRMLRLGARGVQLGTALLADPDLLWRVHEALTVAYRTDEVPVTGRIGGTPCATGSGRGRSSPWSCSGRCGSGWSPRPGCCGPGTCPTTSTGCCGSAVPSSRR